MLKDFLEAILNIHIDKVEVKNPELTPNMADEKLGIQHKARAMAMVDRWK